MDQSKLALTRELGQLFGQPYQERLRAGSPDDALITLERERVVTCGHCGAWLRLIGLPPETLPEEPAIALYYPTQFCPKCGSDAGRALDIEIFPLPGIPGAPVYHKITCSQCRSELRYMTQALPPQYLHELYCPVCGVSLGVEGQAVEVLEEAPWPREPVGEEPKPYRATIIAGGVLAAILATAGIVHAVRKKRR